MTAPTVSNSAPMIEGWFTTSEQPALLGRRCATCGTTAFPPTVRWCPNPGCGSNDLQEVELSRYGRIWSYTDARYQPPPPYVATTDPYEPFAIAAVELAAERMVVLGQVAEGYGLDDLVVGGAAELVVETLEVRDGVERLIWRWRPVSEIPSSEIAEVPEKQAQEVAR